MDGPMKDMACHYMQPHIARTPELCVLFRQSKRREARFTRVFDACRPHMAVTILNTVTTVIMVYSAVLPEPALPPFQQAWACPCTDGDMASLIRLDHGSTLYHISHGLLLCHSGH